MSASISSPSMVVPITAGRPSSNRPLTSGPVQSGWLKSTTTSARAGAGAGSRSVASSISRSTAVPMRPSWPQT